MNYPDSSTVNPTAKKIRFSSATRALLLGLALASAGTTAQADPLTDGLMIIRYKSGGVPITTPTSQDGTYKFKGLAPGSYDLFVGGQRVQTITVGNQGSISGVLSRQPDGTASITFNGQVGVVPDLPSAPVNTSRSNKKAGIAKGEEPPPDDVLPSAPVNTSRSNKKAGIAKAEEPLPDVLTSEAKSAMADVSTTRGTAAGSGGGDGKLPSLAIQGEPIVKIPIGLEGDPGSIKVSAQTDKTGAFHFDKLPAGKYKLTLPGLSPQSVTVGDDGIAGGKVMRGSDGSISIFDRWGNRVASSHNVPIVITSQGDEVGVSKAAGPPGVFGSGNTPLGAGPGIGAGPGMGPGMRPGAGPAVGGPMGGAMGGPGAGRP